MGEHSRFEDEIERNRRLLERKPLLREIYLGFYRDIAAELAEVAGDTVELGSGGDDIKSVIPGCITSNIIRHPGIDRHEDALQLSFSDGTLANLILVDVLHHLRYPGAALAEFRRVLVPGGRVLLLEPDMGLLGQLVYGLFHAEPLGLHESIHWQAPAGHVTEPGDYYAAQGNACRIFVHGEYRDRLSGWKIRKVRRRAAFSYIASGGYTGPQLYPRPALPVLRLLDAAGDRLPRLFATRLLVVLEKAPGPPSVNQPALRQA